MTISTRLLLSAAALLPLCNVAAAQEQTLPQANDPYFAKSRNMLDSHLTRRPQGDRAKNVILFVGDGMGVSTVTAARILAGQRHGGDGPSNDLAMDKLPYSALSRTYSDDAIVTDSAPSAVSMTTGVKSKNDTLGLDHTVVPGKCGTGLELETIAAMAEEAGLSTGVVSTARITHATPASMYAHSASRDWESDSDLDPAAKGKCKDIADQLVHWNEGDGFEVLLGGGRQNFLPDTTKDPEAAGKTGKRTDGRDLTEEWRKRYGNQQASYVWNSAGFDAVDPARTDKLMGLFQPSHMDYEADRADDKAGEPSLAEMTTKAIDILSKNQNGYVLMVEGGRIDHAHHENNAYRALTDAIALDDAIATAVAQVDPSETLIVVTADHSHVFTLAGYPERDTPILGLVRGVDGELTLADDGKPYTILGYQNGPGSVIPAKAEADQATQASSPPTPEAKPTSATTTEAKIVSRPDLTDVDTQAKDYLQQSLAPRESETHGGEDVAIYAEGPSADLFSGTVDEQYTFHVIRHALGWDKM